MNKIIPLAISLIFTSISFAAHKDSELFPTNVPERVRYTRPATKEAQAARTLLEKHFITKSKENIFGDVAAVFPPLWQEIENDEPYKNDHGGVFKIFFDGEQLDGKVLKSEKSKTKLAALLQTKFSSEQTITIRPPNHQELDAYWTVIGWDLGSPLFIVENKTECYLFEFADGFAFWILDMNSRKNL